MKKICNGCGRGPCIRIINDLAMVEGLIHSEPFPKECDLPKPQTNWREISEFLAGDKELINDLQTLLDKKKAIDVLIADLLDKALNFPPPINKKGATQ